MAFSHHNTEYKDKPKQGKIRLLTKVVLLYDYTMPKLSRIFPSYESEFIRICNIENEILDPDISLKQLRQKRIELDNEYIRSTKYERAKLISRYLNYIILAICFIASQSISSGFWNELLSQEHFQSSNLADHIVFYSVTLFLFTSGIFYPYLKHNKSVPVSFIHNIMKSLDSILFDKEYDNQAILNNTTRRFGKAQASTDIFNSIYASQMRGVYYLGISIIIFGVCIIIITTIAGLVRDNLSTLGIAFGFIGGIVTNFIGAVFIHMYTKTMEAVSAFQKSITESSSIDFAFALTSQITNLPLKEQTISDIAKQIANRKS